VLRYALFRILQIFPVLLVITIIVFGLMQLAPGDPFDQLILANPNITSEEIQHMKAVYGLDKPIYIQYLRWVGQVVQGNLGYSRLYRRSVVSLLPDRLANTLVLTSLSLLVSVLIAIPIGVYSGLKQYSWADYALSIFAFVGISLPVFCSGLLLILVFSVTLEWLPPGGHYSLEPGASLLEKARYLILPVIVLSLFSTASWMRYMRSSILEIIHQGYIVTARAKGLKQRVVVLRHALRNALIPVVTLMTLSVPHLISGAVITENIFSWPGMGRLIFDSLMNNDYSLAMAIFLIFATGVALFNLVADLLYAVIDPRITYDG